MKETKVTGKIEFIEKDLQEFNRTFEATLTESGAFDYGNKTAVVIEWGKMANGRTPDAILLDTRYDTTIKRDGSNFKEWLITYFENSSMMPHTLTID